MKLYLSSYKLGNKTEELKKWIDYSKDNKICIIANAKDCYTDKKRVKEGTLKDSEQLKSLGFEVTELDLKKYFNKNEELIEYLNEFRAFYVVGGNTFVLRAAMKLSGFDEYLKKISKKQNYLYAGYSAGICVLSEKMEGIAIMDNVDADPYNYGEIIYSGIGLLNYMPIPHYHSEHPETELANKAVEFCKVNEIAYKTLKDGDVIIEELI